MKSSRSGSLPCGAGQGTRAYGKVPKVLAFPASLSLTTLAVLLLMQGCRAQNPDTPPSIEFTRIPPAAQGGRERVDTIAGRVRGSRPGQHIVVYARSGPWWVQPWPDRPLISIQVDSTWNTETHLGFEYAALLVEPGYQASPTMDVLPNQSATVVAITAVKGSGPIALAPIKPLKFSGYDWKVRTISSDRGGINNLYDGDNAWTDAQGAMHLQIKKKGDKWSCAEVVSERNFGYGTYVTVVRDVSRLEPSTILSFTTFDDWGGEQHYREMDTEFGRWGEPDRKSNAQFGIQPFYVPGNLDPFNAPAGPLTNSMHWESGRASFESVKGESNHQSSPIVAQHVFTTGVPTPGKETFQFLFYVVASEKAPETEDAEVIIEKFEYLP